MKVFYISALIVFATQAVSVLKKPSSDETLLNLDVETEELP